MNLPRLDVKLELVRLVPRYAGKGAFRIADHVFRTVSADDDRVGTLDKVRRLGFGNVFLPGEEDGDARLGQCRVEDSGIGCTVPRDDGNLTIACAAPYLFPNIRGDKIRTFFRRPSTIKEKRIIILQRKLVNIRCFLP